MELEVKNKAYCAVVVALKDFVNLPNCDNVKAALIFGNSVIVSKGCEVGDIGLYFPVETSLSPAFLGTNNLFRKPEWGNADPEQKGFFEEHGRVKAVKFRGHASAGFWIPLHSINGLQPITRVIDTDFEVGMEFNSINGVEVCKKYVPKYKKEPGVPGAKHQARNAKVEDALVDGQFRFHFDTAQLRRNSFKIQPDTIISVSDKWHGTSVICGNLLAKVEHSWFERLVARFGVRLQEFAYAGTAASRRVIKSVDQEAKPGSVHFYKSDIWSTVQEEIKDRIPKGYTVYGEIVGWTKEGGAIQKGYHYGCPQGEHRLLVYRVTCTNQDGKVVDLAWKPMMEFCAKYGLEPVLELFYGKAMDFVNKYHPDESLDTMSCDRDGGNVKLVSLSGKEIEFGEALIEALEHMYLEKPCKHNRNEVPAEGVVVRIDHLEEAENYKLKSFMFLAHESSALDKGDADLEAEEEAAATDSE